MSDSFPLDWLPFPERNPIANRVVMRGGEAAQLLPVGARRSGTLREYARAACGYPIAPAVCRLDSDTDRRCGRCQHTKLGRQVRD